MAERETTIDNWMRIHATLQQHEAALADLTARLARGEAEQTEVAAAEELVAAFKLLAVEVLQRALSDLGRSVRPGRERELPRLEIGERSWCITYRD